MVALCWYSRTLRFIITGDIVPKVDTMLLTHFSVNIMVQNILFILFIYFRFFPIRFIRRRQYPSGFECHTHLLFFFSFTTSWTYPSERACMLVGRAYILDVYTHFYVEWITPGEKKPHICCLFVRNRLRTDTVAHVHQAISILDHINPNPSLQVVTTNEHEALTHPSAHSSDHSPIGCWVEPYAWGSSLQHQLPKSVFDTLLFPPRSHVCFDVFHMLSLANIDILYCRVF